MGSCVSLNKGSESAVKLRLRPRNEKLLTLSPVEETVNLGDRTASDVAQKPRSSSICFAGSDYVGIIRDEAFFDSQPWLESDCEDDYYSVNGDFAPSRGSTPLHQIFASARAADKAEEEVNCGPHDSKRLSEPFQGSVRIADQQPPVEDENLAERNDSKTSPAKSEDKPNVSRTDSAASIERINPVLTIVAAGDEVVKSGQCCAPILAKCELMLRTSYDTRRGVRGNSGKKNAK